jgi:hypothetical protein
MSPPHQKNANQLSHQHHNTNNFYIVVQFENMNENDECEFLKAHQVAIFRV